MAADEQMFTGAQISSVNIVTVARCGWISRGRRGGKYKRVEKDGYKGVFEGGYFTFTKKKKCHTGTLTVPKSMRLRWEEMLQQQPGSKETQTSIKCREAKKHECYLSGQQTRSAHTLALFSIITHNTNQITLGCVRGRE